MPLPTHKIVLFPSSAKTGYNCETSMDAPINMTNRLSCSGVLLRSGGFQAPFVPLITWGNTGTDWLITNLCNWPIIIQVLDILLFLLQEFI